MPSAFKSFTAAMIFSIGKGKRLTSKYPWVTYKQEKDQEKISYDASYNPR